MGDIKVSALVFTRNEERRLKGLLNNIKDVVDEIVIIDGCSTDRTADIALSYGAKVYQVKPLGYVEPCRMYGLSKVSYEYVLYLDADERLNDSLRKDLRKIVKLMHDKGIVAIRVLRRNYITSKKYSRYLFYPDFQVRIFNKNYIEYKGIVHEQPIVRGKIVRLNPEKYWIYHFTVDTYNLEGFRSKLLKYAYLAAMQRPDNLRSFIFSITLPASFTARIVKYVIMKRAFLDGIEGLTAALSYIAYLQTVDLIKAFRSTKWDIISRIANTTGLSFLCRPVVCESLSPRST